MTTVLAIINALFGSRVIAGVTISQIITYLGTPQGQAAVSAGKKVIGGLIKDGDSLATAVLKFLAMVGKIHQMSPSEEKIWMDRASNTGVQ